MRRRSVFDRFRAIAHEGEVDKRVQFTIEELYRVRARGFEAEGFAAVIPSLDLVRRSCPFRVDVYTQVQVVSSQSEHYCWPSWQQQDSVQTIAAMHFLILTACGASGHSAALRVFNMLHCWCGAVVATEQCELHGGHFMIHCMALRKAATVRHSRSAHIFASALRS